MKQYLQEKFGEDEISAAGLNRFISAQSRDLLFCLRCTNLVRSMNRELGGTTVDRFLAFGIAASRGAYLSSFATSDEIGAKTSNISTDTPMNDVLAHEKAYLNMPVASELHAQKRAELEGIQVSAPHAAIVVRRTLFDYIEKYKLSLRTWLHGFLLDALIFLTGATTDLNPRNLG